MLTVGAVLLLALVVGVYVFQPLRGGSRSRRATRPAEDEELLLVRDQLFHDIREAEFDHQVGKLCDDDYAEVVARLKAKAADVVDRIDGVAPTETAAPRSKRDRAGGDIEARIAAARKRGRRPRPTSTPKPAECVCPTCKATNPAEAQFCMKCGSQLPAQTKDTQ